MGGVLDEGGDPVRKVEKDVDRDAQIERLQYALDQSVKLQSHYAALLNMEDGGKRKQFTADEWLRRLDDMDRKAAEIGRNVNDQ